MIGRRLSGQNNVCATDFVHDQLALGDKLGILTIVDANSDRSMHPSDLRRRWLCRKCDDQPKFESVAVRMTVHAWNRLIERTPAPAPLILGTKTILIMISDP